MPEQICQRNSFSLPKNAWFPLAKLQTTDSSWPGCTNYTFRIATYTYVTRVSRVFRRSGPIDFLRHDDSRLVITFTLSYPQLLLFVAFFPSLLRWLAELSFDPLPLKETSLYTYDRYRMKYRWQNTRECRATRQQRDIKYFDASMLLQKVEESYDTRLLVVPWIFMHLCESRSCRNTQDTYDMQKCVCRIFEMRQLR